MVPKAEISNDIRGLRFTHGEMTQQDLADRIGCTRQTVIMLEQGRYVPSLAFAEIADKMLTDERVDTMRTSAFVIAIEKVARSYLELGVFP